MLCLSWDIFDYLNNNEPHIGYAVKNGLDKGEKVDATVLEGSYYDCGTPSEYVDLLKNNLISE